MTRGLFLLFGVMAYLVFFLVFLYLIGFLADLAFLPRTVDHGPLIHPLPAIVADLILIAIFGLQHSIMARGGFKRAAAAAVPPPIERSLYVLATSAALILLFAVWRPIPLTIWRVEYPVGRDILWALFALGWLIVLLSTFLISHFELFGLKQVWLNLAGRAPEPPRFRQPLFYRRVRHPVYSGFFLAFWATPHMTLGHLIFALGMSAYMLIAIPYEERDLITAFGEEYLTYRRNVGMLAPRLRRRI